MIQLLEQINKEVAELEQQKIENKQKILDLKENVTDLVRMKKLF